jgi:hypothetical protein
MVAAYIHTLLGSLIFMINAAGFAVLAAGLVVPLAFADRYRLLARLALAGFSAGTIGGWLFFGARFSLGYLATGIEVAIIGLLVVDTLAVHGMPRAIGRELLEMAHQADRLVHPAPSPPAQASAPRVGQSGPDVRAGEIR